MNRFGMKVSVFLVVATLAAVLGEARADAGNRSRPAVQQQISKEYAHRESDLRRKQALDRSELLSVLQRKGASKSLRLQEESALKKRHQLEHSWLKHEEIEELCVRAKTKCHRLPVRDLASNDAIPAFAQDTGFDEASVQ